VKFLLSIEGLLGSVSEFIDFREELLQCKIKSGDVDGFGVVRNISFYYILECTLIPSDDFVNLYFDKSIKSFGKVEGAVLHKKLSFLYTLSFTSWYQMNSRSAR